MFIEVTLVGSNKKVILNDCIIQNIVSAEVDESFKEIYPDYKKEKVTMIVLTITNPPKTELEVPTNQRMYVQDTYTKIKSQLIYPISSKTN